MNADEARQYADEARQYAKELQEENKEARALGPLNKWLIRRCIRKIDKEIRRATNMGRDYYIVVFSIISLFPLKDLDKLFLVDHYKSLGYHVELRSGSMGVSWAVVSPWLFSGNDTTLGGN